MAAYHVGEVVQGGTRQRQTGGVDKAVRALDGVVVLAHDAASATDSVRCRIWGDDLVVTSQDATGTSGSVTCVHRLTDPG
ncbi:hypothetical protein GCM10009601_50110 [Streptomyces thermospinosisporus]|uniref:Uncharacterized protein n=1 Tax=Streptomyces thermospinosisporus TaxID=161482 RepID=A0ABP4JXU4_9ACTN